MTTVSTERPADSDLQTTKVLAEKSTKSAPRKGAAGKPPAGFEPVVVLGGKKPQGFRKSLQAMQVVDHLANAPFGERVDQVRHGLRFGVIDSLTDVLGASKESTCRILDIPMSTLTRRQRSGLAMTPGQSERVLALVDLIATVVKMVRESGNSEGFDAGIWLSHWLETPNPALNGEAPGTYMDTADGRAKVANLLERMQAGAYS